VRVFSPIAPRKLKLATANNDFDQGDKLANSKAYSIKFASQEDTSGTVQEDGTLTATGKLTAVDSDSHATLSWSVVNGDGTYGTLSVDASGKWTYILDNSDANVQALAVGEKVSDSFTVRVIDNHGVSATQTVTMKIAGSEDAPTISAGIGQDTGAVQEDGTLKATGTLSGADIDHGTHLAWSVAGGGDTVAALNHAGVADAFSYVSTAGGAFLEWLEGGELPGVAALARKKE